MADRLTYRDVRAIERHYCRENDNIVGFFGSSEDDSDDSDPDPEAED